jgi:hypothetical protein
MPSGEFAGSLSALLRSYLEGRFGYAFSAAATAEIIPAFQSLTGDTLDPAQEQFVLDLYALFVRFDYIRFAGSGMPETELSPDERIALGEKVREMILFSEEKDTGSATTKGENRASL